LAVIGSYVTDGYTLQIRLLEEAAQDVSAAIPDPNGAQCDSFAGGNTAILAQRRAWDYLWHR
jgi:hypothetical protein